MMVYKTAESAAFARGKKLTKEAILLLRILSAKYRAGLNPHLELIATYIGSGCLTTEIQLEGNVLIVSRLLFDIFLFLFCKIMFNLQLQ